jgi:hypothetical protein
VLNTEIREHPAELVVAKVRLSRRKDLRPGQRPNDPVDLQPALLVYLKRPYRGSGSAPEEPIGLPGLLVTQPAQLELELQHILPAHHRQGKFQRPRVAHLDLNFDVDGGMEAQVRRSSPNPPSSWGIAILHHASFCRRACLRSVCGIDYRG